MATVTRLIFCLLLVAFVLAVFAPIAMREIMAKDSLKNIKESLQNTNDALGNSPVGQFLQEIDATTQ